MTTPEAAPTAPAQPIKIKFQADHLPRLDLFRARGDLRYYLEGVWIERAEIGGLYLVATDGHTMLAIHDANGVMEGPEGGALLRITPELVAAGRKGITYNYTAHVIAVGNRVSIATDFGEEHSNFETFIQAGMPWITGAKYPDWRKVLPDFANLQPGFTAAVNGTFLARFAKIKPSANLSRHCLPELNFWQESKGRSVIVQMPGLPEAIAIVMPMKSSNKEAASATDLFANFPQKATTTPAEATT